MLHIVKPNEIDSVIGKDLGASEWMVIDQERIDKFADATMDHQFIHVDPEQARTYFWLNYSSWLSFIISCRWHLFRARNWHGA